MFYTACLIISVLTAVLAMILVPLFIGLFLYEIAQCFFKTFMVIIFLEWVVISLIVLHLLGLF